MKILTYHRVKEGVGVTVVTANSVVLCSTCGGHSVVGETKAKARKALQKKLMALGSHIDDALNQIERDIEREEA